ncbi:MULTISPECIES: ornithine cyclodeaminase family protein [unclassified Sphingomonas]|nr:MULTISPECIES: ornithine cyclodeaminase family protein [unclassified Sphingomonas]KQX22650.1 hypothetical protein ASD17_04975 [Sphingomonas sp. Root1294]KQY67871.1 hypothetical protein ASD39_08155 [Sphingomonas sp. Root50]KRB88795.1 hypothetical protein ASE22_20500 [Sphingomonas sp. Root720]
MDGTPAFLDADTVRASLSLDRCMAAMREVMIALSGGVTAQLPRGILPLDGKLLGVMAGALSGGGFFGAKILGVADDPAQPGRQWHHGLVILFDGDSGKPVCIADAEEITLLRTAAVSAVATDMLARRDAKSLGIFGHGTQAQAHIRAITHIRRLDEILVWGRSFDKARSFAEEVASSLKLPVRAVAKPEEVAACDILCTLTPAVDPILKGAWVQEGAHVNVVGFAPAGRGEVDGDLVRKSRYFTDSRASVEREGNEFLDALRTGAIGPDHRLDELGAVLAGTVEGRRLPTEISLYRSLGHVAQDLAALTALHLSRQASS